MSGLAPVADQGRVGCVLHLIPTLGPGGAERQLGYLSAGLVQFGWEVHVAYLDEGPNLARLARSGAVLHRIPNRGSYDPRILLQLTRLIARVRPDIVQTWLPAMDIPGGLAARLRGVPWIMSERSLPEAYERSLKLRSQAVVARLARAVIANSAGGAASWAARLPRGVPCHVVPNGLPLEEIAAVEPATGGEFALSKDLPLAFFVGRLDSGKNIDVLLHAFELAVKQCPMAALVGGEGPLYAQVQAFIQQRRLEGRLAAPGFVPEVWSWMKRARVFVSLSRFEGMPNAVMEAMAAGCPLVLSDTPTHREFIPDDCALYVPTDSAEAASKAILATLHDPEAAARRTSKARERALCWSIESASRRHDEIYRGLLGETRGRAARWKPTPRTDCDSV